MELTQAPMQNASVSQQLLDTDYAAHLLRLQLPRPHSIKENFQSLCEKPQRLNLPSKLAHNVNSSRKQDRTDGRS